jgi:hypothetical protein
VTRALHFFRLVGLAQTSAALVLGQSGMIHWAFALFCAAASYTGYVEASERLRLE